MGLNFGGKFPCRMTVWEIRPYEKSSIVRLSSSKKNMDGNWVTDFSMGCRFAGEAHKKAKILKEKDTITPKNVDVSVVWNKEQQKNDVSVLFWDFALIDKDGNITEITDDLIKQNETATSNGFMDIPADIDADLPFK